MVQENIPKKNSRSKIAAGLALLLLLWLVILSIKIYTYASVSDPSPADAAIVLGAAAWGDVPSPVFEERIKHAINLYRTGQVQVLIFTGGVGEGERLAESAVAREYAIRHGVSAAHIYCETTSRITYENLTGAWQIVEQQNLTRVLIVSDPLHTRRAVTIARDLGLEASPSPTPTSRYVTRKSRLRFLLRETLFYAAYLLRRPFL